MNESGAPYPYWLVTKAEYRHDRGLYAVPKSGEKIVKKPETIVKNSEQDCKESEMEMAYIFEKPGSPKIGKRIPNSKIVIKSDDELVNHDVENIIIWAWHLETEISEYLGKLGYTGTIWTILPNFRAIN